MAARGRIWGCSEKSKRYTRGWRPEERCKSTTSLPAGKNGECGSHRGHSNLTTSGLGASSGRDNHRGGENARPTPLPPCVSPVIVVLEASDSLQRAEVVVELPPILTGGEPLRSPPQHHLSLAAAYLAGSEVHGELRGEGRGFQSKQTVTELSQITSSRVETPDGSEERR